MEGSHSWLLEFQVQILIVDVSLWHICLHDYHHYLFLPSSFFHWIKIGYNILQRETNPNKKYMEWHADCTIQSWVKTCMQISYNGNLSKEASVYRIFEDWLKLCYLHTEPTSLSVRVHCYHIYTWHCNTLYRVCVTTFKIQVASQVGSRKSFTFLVHMCEKKLHNGELHDL